MRVALLISGHCRTFVFKEQYMFFKRFIKSLNCQCDTYIMLKQDEKMQSKQGIKNLKKIIKMIKPLYSICFKQWAVNNDVYYSQMNMIYFLIQKALAHEKLFSNERSNENKYDFFIRIRPDLILNETIDLTKLNKSKLYTSLKYDARGNDQFFIMSQEQLYNWFLKLPMHPSIYNKLPDYIIFNNIVPLQIVGSGLVRDYKDIDSWNHCHCKLNPKNYWIKKENFLNKDKDLSNSLMKINYQETI